MHTNNFIKNLLGFKDVIITKIHNTDNRIEIYLEMKKKPHTCHRCNSETRRVHDYRIQRVKHLPFFLKPTVLIIKNVGIVVMFVVRDSMKMINSIILGTLCGL